MSAHGSSRLDGTARFFGTAKTATATTTEIDPTMKTLLHTVVRVYGWIHLSRGLFGNVSFFVGSILFLPVLAPYKIIGAFSMMTGAIGLLLSDVWNGSNG